MTKQKANKNSWSGEAKVLITLSLLFVGVLTVAWLFALNLKQSIAAGNSGTQVDLRAQVEVERMRNLVETQLSDSRSFFLLGSSSLLEEARKDKQAFQEALTNFEKQYTLPQIPEIIKSINDVELQQQDIFDQAMKFREKHTEAKIVGQFYNSKIAPLRTRINQSLDEMTKLHKAEVDRTRSQFKAVALSAETKVPKGMTWLTGALSFLFLGMIFLGMRLLGERSRRLAERDRLYIEAQGANQSRDELLVAVSQDLNESLHGIVTTVESVTGDENKVAVESIKSSVAIIEGLIKDISDQAKAEQKSLTLRLDQLSIDTILDEARLMLQPIAKQRDIRLQFDSVNPPTLAFYDRERVLRVLSNLVGNAIKFSPKHSKVVVKVRSDQQFVYVSVIDSGPGIPENQLAEIFDHFWQARTTADQGAGVGLAIVKTIVEAHGGIVKVDSTGGNGSTFTFSLPRRRPVGAQLGRPSPIIKQTPRWQEPPSASL